VPLAFDGEKVMNGIIRWFCEDMDTDVVYSFLVEFLCTKMRKSDVQRYFSSRRKLCGGLEP
jgi:hypothetical protein